MYTKRDDTITDFNSYVQSKTGMDIASFRALQYDNTYNTKLQEVARYLQKYAINNPQDEVYLIGDYDCDGIMAVCILYLVLSALNFKVKIIIPRRFSDGYGVSQNIMDMVPDGKLAVFVDNGIAGAAVINPAVERGVKVVILDHHECLGEAPKADIIADPKYDDTYFTYSDYCGAGLAYRVACQLFPEDTRFLEYLSAFAAAATVADVVPVLGDNRLIIREGLAALNTKKCAPGLTRLAQMLYEEEYEESDIAYKLAPAINAPGRLEDSGGMIVAKAMLINGDVLGPVTQIIELNKRRKSLTESVMNRVNPIGTHITYVYEPDIPLGLCGIIAGKLAEEKRRPAFVMTDAGDGIVKGSARNYETENILEIAEPAKDLFTVFGGHKPAAGFTIPKDNVWVALEVMDTNYPYAEAQENNLEYYDFEVDAMSLVSNYNTYCTLKPYGEKFEEPVIKVRINVTKVRYVGSDQNTLQLEGTNMRFVGFKMGAKYQELGAPTQITVYGRFSTNKWQGRTYPQFMIHDLEV